MLKLVIRIELYQTKSRATFLILLNATAKKHLMVVLEYLH